jgi:hypothetical protein
LVEARGNVCASKACRWPKVVLAASTICEPSSSIGVLVGIVGKDDSAAALHVHLERLKLSNPKAFPLAEVTRDTRTAAILSLRLTANLYTITGLMLMSPRR